MGRTLPSAAQVFEAEEKSLARFRRALRRSDQRALDELFNFAQAHVAEAAYAAHALPMEIYLLSMLLEEHKQVVKLREQVEALRGKPDPALPLFHAGEKEAPAVPTVLPEEKTTPPAVPTVLPEEKTTRPAVPTVLPLEKTTQPAVPTVLPLEKTVQPVKKTVRTAPPVELTYETLSEDEQRMVHGLDGFDE